MGSAPARGTGARLVAAGGFGAGVVCRVAGAGGLVAFDGVAAGFVVVVVVVVALVVLVMAEVGAGDVDAAVVSAESG